MKILYSCLSKSWGGMEMFTLTSVKQLLKRNISVEFLCAEESRLQIEANNLGIIVHTLKATWPHYFSNIIRLALLIRRSSYNIIHSHASGDLWFFVPALKILNNQTPLLLTKHVASFIVKKDLLHRWIYNRLNFAIAISTMIKKNLMETCLLPESKVLLLHNGVDLARFNPERVDSKKVRIEFNIDDREILIGMLARFSPGKGHEEFLFAASKLNKKYSNLKFIITGEASRGENSYMDSIKKVASNYKLTNLIFTGFRSDTPEVLSAMDVFVFPSHAESFGIALIEAMAMGKPCVCSNADGVLDIAVDGESALFFKNRDAEDLFDKLVVLIESDELRRKLSVAARKRVAEKFDIEKFTERLLEIYKQAQL